jgi:hypothetical protein
MAYATEDDRTQVDRGTSRARFPRSNRSARTSDRSCAISRAAIAGNQTRAVHSTVATRQAPTPLTR